MKKHLTRLLCLMLCLALAFALGGCGKTTPGENSSDPAGGTFFDFDDETDGTLSKGDGTASGNAGDPLPDIGDVSDAPVHVDISGDNPLENIPKRLRGTTLVFACWGDEGSERYADIYQNFTRLTGINVKILYISEGNIANDIAQRIAAHNAPDVTVNNYRPVSMYGILQPLNGYFDLDDPFWDQEIIAATTVGKNTYCINSLEAMWQGANFLVYNKDLFREKGVPSPGDYWKRGDWTYENFFKCIETLSATGVAGGYIEPEQLAASLGAPLVSFDAKAQKYVNNMKSDVVNTAYSLCHDMNNNGCWPSSAWTSLFPNGQIGVLDGGNYAIRADGLFAEADGNMMGAVPFPTSYKGQPTYQPYTLRSYGIVRGAKNPEAAAYFLRYFLDYDYYKEAGINPYKSKELETFYIDEFLPKVKSGELKRMLQYNQAVWKYLNPTGALPEVVSRADVRSEQWAAALNSVINVMQRGVDGQNKELENYK